MSTMQPDGVPDPEAERTRFRRLQLRLARIWDATHSTRPWAHSAVIVPSLSMDQDELAKIQGVSFYEERLLFSLIRLRNPEARVLYLTSQPIHQDIIDYYLQLLVGVPASHARRRLALMCVYDASPRPLTAKILDRPRVVARIRQWIGNPRRSYMTCFNSTELERQLAIELGVPLNGVDPDLLPLGTKTGSRETFAEAGVAHPAGYENLQNADDVARALGSLREQEPQLRRAVVKLNSSFAGEGNALFRYPEDPAAVESLRRGDLDVLRDGLVWSTPGESFERYFRKFEELRGITEAYVEAEEVLSPSVQLRIDPAGKVELISTHDQVLGGSTGQKFEGCYFPAREDYRALIQEEGMRVGAVLAEKGATGRLAVDFVVYRSGGGPFQSSAIEINLRMGGTTFPFVALKFLTGGDIEAATGRFFSTRGTEKFYFATDALKSDRYRGLLPEDLMDLMIGDGLYFNPATETGVLFHMIGALSEFGKLGVVSIGDSREQAKALFEGTRDALDGAASGQKRRSRPRKDGLPRHSVRPE